MPLTCPRLYVVPGAPPVEVQWRMGRARHPNAAVPPCPPLPPADQRWTHGDVDAAVYTVDRPMRPFTAPPAARHRGSYIQPGVVHRPGVYTQEPIAHQPAPPPLVVPPLLPPHLGSPAALASQPMWAPVVAEPLSSPAAPVPVPEAQSQPLSGPDPVLPPLPPHLMPVSAAAGPLPPHLMSAAPSSPPASPVAPLWPPHLEPGSQQQPQTRGRLEAVC